MVYSENFGVAIGNQLLQTFLENAGGRMGISLLCCNRAELVNIPSQWPEQEELVQRDGN